jgi:flagellar biogenesis protein FliO
LNYGNIFAIVGPILIIGIIILMIFLIKKWRNRFETRLTKLTEEDICL